MVGPTHDDTLEMLSEYGGRVRVLRCPEANLSQSRNIGLLDARGDVVAYIDDDAVPCRRWLEQLACLFADPSLDATGGVVHLTHPQRPMVQHRLGLTSSLFEQEVVRSSWLEHIAPPGRGHQWIARMMGTNMAFRREALLDIGGFDEFFVYIAEEADVMIRLVNAGYVIHPVKEAVVYHVPASSRHRVTFSYQAKWWLQTRSGVYFTIKNGRAAGDPVAAVALRCLHLVHGHWMWYGELREKGELSVSQLWKMRMGEVWGALDGAWSGTLRRRQTIPRAAALAARESSPPPIQPFPHRSVPSQPALDPVSGRQPARSSGETAQGAPLCICLLSATYPPQQFDGIARLTHLMAQGLFELGHTVHVIARGEREQVSFYDGAYVHRIPYKLCRYDRYRQFPSLYHSLNYSHAVCDKVRRLALNDGVQIVDSPIWLTEGLVTAVSGIIPVVVRIITAYRQIAALKDDRSDDARLMGDMEEMFLERAAHLLPNTEATLDTVRRVYDLALTADRFTLVPYGIVPAPDEDIRPFDPGRKSDALTVLYVGRLEQRKGILDLFEAIPRVVGQLPNVRFVIAGQDNSRHDGFQARTGTDYVSYFARQYGQLGSSVEFLGRVSDETLQTLYQSCDLFVAPSLYESFGLIYLEAMNYAKPVIGCRSGGVPEVIEDGVTGLLVEPQAPAALAEAIISTLRSPQMLREMGMAGRQRLLDQFTYLEMARRFARVYRQVIRDFSEVHS
ncbi:MAG TPA: glycosyltransferase [Chloroflexi bacterium]|nr:glycosyltransferase [Chloroflexota bacterium]